EITLDCQGKDSGVFD
ncbi:unnamed protein product, partial [Allacma fusca]